MMQTFLQELCETAQKNGHAELDVQTCRRLLKGLCKQMTSDGESSELEKCKGLRIVGQDTLVNRTVTSLLMNEHLLLEGLPGVAKTVTVKFLAEDAGLISIRVQFFPDMLPSDLVGKTTFDVQALHANTAREAGSSAPHADVEHWYNGPLFCNLLVADEINRAPSKVQAALLEAMGERQITPLGHNAHVIRSDREWEMWLRHIRSLQQAGMVEKEDIWGSFDPSIGQLPLDRLDAKTLHPAVQALNSQRFKRFGDNFPFGKKHEWTDPHPLFGASPITLSASGDAQLTVFATQNPIEQAGTYPMSEAQVDRFNMKHVVRYPDYDSILRIGLMINRPKRARDPDDEYNIPIEREQTAEHRACRDAALRASLYFFRRARELIFGKPGDPGSGALGAMISAGACEDAHSMAGKIARIVYYTHIRMPRTSRAAEADSIMADPEQNERLSFLFSRPGVRQDVDLLAKSDIFEYVNSGASPRGFMGLTRAALAHAFLRGSGHGIRVVEQDVRAMAYDVLGHRIRLNSQARVRELTSRHLLDVVMNHVLREKDSE